MRSWSSWILTYAAAVTLASGQQCLASYVYIDYHAGPAVAGGTPASVWSPEMWLWNDLNAGAAGTGVVNVLGSGKNAWRITDSLPALPNPAYVTELIPRAAADAVRDGWRFAATARYVDDFNTGANMGLSTYIGGRAYHLMFDLTAGGDLQATLHDETPRVYRLTNGRVGATALHRFQLQSSPGTANVSFLFDGATIDSQWNGIAINHAATAQWGNSGQAGSGRGVMEFQEVAFEIGPFLAGDFDNSGVVDGRDFLFWQRNLNAPYDRFADGNNDGRVDGADLAIWRQNFGRAATAGAGLATPEPYGWMMAAIGAAGLGAQRRRLQSRSAAVGGFDAR